MVIWCDSDELDLASPLVPGCYRIMEAAIEQACCQGAPPTDAHPQVSIASLTLQQSRQVLGVLEEAFSAQMYHLQQVNSSSHPGTRQQTSTCVTTDCKRKDEKGWK